MENRQATSTCACYSASAIEEAALPSHHSTALQNPKYSVHQSHEMTNKNMNNPEISVCFFLELELMFVLSQI
jgi:hypothetical protein